MNINLQKYRKAEGYDISSRWDRDNEGLVKALVKSPIRSEKIKPRKQEKSSPEKI